MPTQAEALRRVLRRSVFIDSNYLSKEVFASIRQRAFEQSLALVLPQCILEEVYKGTNPQLGVVQSLDHLRECLEIFYVTAEARTLAPWERKSLIAAGPKRIVDVGLTEKIRATISNGIEQHFINNQARFRFIMARATGMNGKLNPVIGLQLIDLCAGRIMEAVKELGLTKKYRNKSEIDWRDGPIDEDLTTAAVCYVRKELTARPYSLSSDLTRCKHYVDQAPFLFRYIVAGIIRRLILEGGNSFGQQRLGNQGEFANHIYDVEFCAFASYRRMVATKDKANIGTIRHLHRAIDICRGRVSRQIEVIM